ncbi:hypothetical protein DPMN_056540 [Dreissena polymorpha]|uniref:Uncharacterized protein n=1 Tax=Dreissena polymorpha TaxID=45954 RepID=A0A9D4CUP9_DREPO|nr:hypothetical protein DPMN_056540 [Dreissena polymorpha]
MSKFYEHWEKKLSSRLFTCCHYIHIKKTAPLHGGHVSSLITTIFKLVQDIHITNVLQNFMMIRQNIPLPPGGHVFLPILTIIELNCPIQVWKNAPPPLVTIFELTQDIIGKNHLSKFHEDRKINVASRVLTRKNAPPPGVNVFQPTDIIFELVQDIIGMNLLTKVLTRKNASPLGSHANVDVAQSTTDNGQRTTDDGQKAITTAHYEHVVLR